MTYFFLIKSLKWNVPTFKLSLIWFILEGNILSLLLLHNYIITHCTRKWKPIHAKEEFDSSTAYIRNKKVYEHMFSRSWSSFWLRCLIFRNKINFWLYQRDIFWCMFTGMFRCGKVCGNNMTQLKIVSYKYWVKIHRIHSITSAITMYLKEDRSIWSV